jgi:hypothetical protein
MVTRQEPFEIGEGRVMVSLGPLHNKRYCTYSCPFCYVNADYSSFGSHDLDDIVDWIGRQSSNFETIYVSGDTDSFAPPRLSKGIELLETLQREFDKDLLFTTRALFDNCALDRVARLTDLQRRKKKWLFGCVSIAQFSVPHIEPRPVPNPRSRAAQLGEFRRRGLVAVLALRPFLPNVPLSDYSQIMDLCEGGIDIVLGEDWYADINGVLESAVLGPSSPRTAVNIKVAKMPFDSNEADWRVYKLDVHETYVRSACDQRGLPFFMRSQPALDHWRRAHEPEE